MSGVVTDIKNLCLQELPIYVAIAALFSFIVLEITGTSFVVPILFLLCIGISILYNMGTNIFLGEISYLTQALVAILQRVDHPAAGNIHGLLDLPAGQFRGE